MFHKRTPVRPLKTTQRSSRATESAELLSLLVGAPDAAGFELDEGAGAEGAGAETDRVEGAADGAADGTGEKSRTTLIWSFWKGGVDSPTNSP